MPILTALFCCRFLGRAEPRVPWRDAAFGSLKTLPTTEAPVVKVKSRSSQKCLWLDLNFTQLRGRNAFGQVKHLVAATTYLRLRLRYQLIARAT